MDEITRKSDRRAGFVQPQTNKRETPDEKFERHLQKAGIGTVGNFVFDPLSLTDAEFEERKRVRDAYNRFDERGAGDYYEAFYVRLNSGDIVPAHDLRMYFDRLAYELLRQNVDDRTIMKVCHLYPEELEELKQRHKIN